MAQKVFKKILQTGAYSISHMIMGSASDIFTSYSILTESEIMFCHIPIQEQSFLVNDMIIFFLLFTPKGHRTRANKNRLKKIRFLPEPIKRTVGEIEAGS